MKNLRICLLGLVATLLFVAKQSEAQTLPVTEGEQPLQKSITMNLFPNPSNGDISLKEITPGIYFLSFFADYPINATFATLKM